jgi:hypothetical protein
MSTHASNSSLSVVRVCERKFAYKYPLKVKPVDRESSAMLLGSWWHALRAIDSTERGIKHESLLKPTTPRSTGDSGLTLVPDGTDLLVKGLQGSTDLGRLSLSAGSVLIAASAWWAEQTSEKADEYLAKWGASLPDLLDGLNSRWLDHYAEALPSQRPLLVEQKWERQVGNTDLYLIGYTDEVQHDLSKGVTVVVDWKSHASWPSESESVLDLMDSQLHLYAWGVSALLADTKYSVQALTYDRVRVKNPATPTLTKTGNLSKATTDYDLWSYLRWVETGPTYERYKKDVTEDELEIALYAEANLRVTADGVTLDEALSYVKPSDLWQHIDLNATITEPSPKVVESLSGFDVQDKFFRRHLVPVNVSVIKAHLRAAVSGYEQGNRVRADVKAGKDIARSPGKACAWCEYLPVCKAEMFGDVSGSADPASFNLKALPVWPGR